MFVGLLRLRVVRLPRWPTRRAEWDELDLICRVDIYGIKGTSCVVRSELVQYSRARQVCPDDVAVQRGAVQREQGRRVEARIGGYRHRVMNFWLVDLRQVEARLVRYVRVVAVERDLARDEVHHVAGKQYDQDGACG